MDYKFTSTDKDNNPEELDLFKVNEPWAMDANDNPVPTYYEVNGNSITQIIEPTSDTTYPVLADPTWEWYQAAYGVGWNKAETRELQQYTAAPGVLCAAVPGAALKAVCAAGAASWAVNTNKAVARGGCVFYAIAPVPVGLNYDASKHCK